METGDIRATSQVIGEAGPHEIIPSTRSFVMALSLLGVPV
jgi:hypothetical protein